MAFPSFRTDSWTNGWNHPNPLFPGMQMAHSLLLIFFQPDEKILFSCAGFDPRVITHY